MNRICFLGKVFPKLQRRTERQAISLSTSDDDHSLQMNSESPDEDVLPSSPNGDYVFRVVFFPER